MIGHSFGGAVIVRAAMRTPQARMLVALAPQAAGTEGVAVLGPRTALLCVHGTRDEILPAECSRYLNPARANQSVWC